MEERPRVADGLLGGEEDGEEDRSNTVLWITVRKRTESSFDVGIWSIGL
jgi:hypothetical protein